jgi:N-acetylmuramoyl-L-alanine amidase
VGDTGTGGPDQFKVAGAIFQTCASSGCDFGLLLGDNFYPDGVSSADDPQRKTKFEQPYFAVLRATAMPAVLVETEFITHPRQLEFLSDPESQEALVDAVADGIEGSAGSASPSF